jgi:hypothetical protein
VGNSTAIEVGTTERDTVKRKALITLILGATLVIAPAARAGGLMPDGGGSGSAKGVVLHTDVLGGNGNAVSSSVLTTRPYGMNEATYQAVLSRGKAFSLRPDILGGHAGVSAGTTATGGDSFNWGVAIPASLLGAMLLAAAALALTRRRYRVSF